MTGSSELKAASLIERLLRVGNRASQLAETVGEQELVHLCTVARQQFLKQSAVVQLSAPITVIGDLHGQYCDALRMFQRMGFPPQRNCLMLGDYVDRGAQSIETVALLFAFKCQHPDRVCLLRGNHETAAINKVYGFYQECHERYSTKLWAAFQDAFNAMPLAAVVSGKILCMHGGLSPAMSDWRQLEAVSRPIDPPDSHMAADVLWTDPNPEHQGWRQNQRGISYTFGVDVVHAFVERNHIDLIARAHQVVQDGYEFFASRRLVTIFSAPNYCGTYANAAAVMHVDADLQCSFDTFQPAAARPVSSGYIGDTAGGGAQQTASANAPDPGARQLHWPAEHE